ncbi:hypothetical protein TRVA0_045S00804 [Trichomonascus vanleenenianus]|uniref:uncharacterized protein n=1 Tax=Trichomonascus vanleenenianus TaxID=2268995 RepID=UPI003ECAB039
MDTQNQEYRILEGDEANFFAATEEGHQHSLAAAAAAAVANVDGSHHHHHHHPHNGTAADLDLANAMLNASAAASQAPPPQTQHHHHQAPHNLSAPPGMPVGLEPTSDELQPPPPQPQHHHAAPPPPHENGANGAASVVDTSTLEHDAAAAAAVEAVKPIEVYTANNQRYYSCPFPHCQFMGKKVPEIQRHMGRNQHKGLKNRTVANYKPEEAYVPAAMANTAMIVDREFNLAVCRNGSYILSKNEIPAHAKLCEMCQAFDETLTAEDDYQRIADHVDLSPWKIVQPHSDESNYEAGMLRRLAGTYRDDNDDNDKRFLCIYCYNEGKLFTMGRKDGNHLYNVHSINPDNRNNAWVPCRGMSYRLLGKGFCDQSKFYVAVKSEESQVR